METKPPSFVPMPQYVLPFQPKGVEIVLWCMPQTAALGHEVVNQFPQRPMAGLSEHRQREHEAVSNAMSVMLGHNQWHITHDDHGKPWLHTKDGTAKESVGIAHCDAAGEVWAAVARWHDRRHSGGIDLVLSDDPRLKRVAPRVMSSNEQTLWAGREAWAWGTKEAMFKGHGPALDFQTEALLKGLTEAPDGGAGTLIGEARGAPWCGRWTRLEGGLLLIWTA